jgi:hypothetical protein
MYFAAGASVWRNSDVTAIPLGSSSPTTVNWTMLQNSTVSSSTISALAASKEPSGVLYYGSSSGRVYKMNDAHQAQPAAINLSVNAGFPSGGYVSSITVDPLNADRVLVAFSNYSVPSLFSSTNGGSSWTDVSGNLEEQPNGAGNGPSVRWVAMLPDSAAYYYFVGTSTGLYSSRSLQGGSTVWVHEGTNSIGYPVVDMIGVRESDGYVAVGTHGRGVFTSTVPIVPPPPENRPVPSSFAVSENFPNPFNAGTNVTLTIEKSGHVRVDVFDMSGSLVSTLADQNFLPTSSGVRIYWNGTNSIGLPAATGVYLIAARTDSQVRATKAVLIR